MPAGKKTGTKRASSGKTPTAKRPRVRKAENATTTTTTTLKFKSPAEFFAENKNIAGFDNPGKSLYTTIRELVENGLDAAESINALPDIDVVVERITKNQFRSMVGIDSRDRVDETLYKDVENDRERKAREAREKREEKREAKKRARTVPEEGKDLKTDTKDAKDAKDVPVEKKERAGGNEIFRVTVTDNGSGMAHADVPNMMGRVLAGTKYCVRQARGKFGLGSKMALIWSKMSTGLPVKVKTAKFGMEVTTCVLDIDIAKNSPTIIEHVKRPNPDYWRGTKVSVTIEGNWSTYRSKILTYMRQMAVITPYAKFRLKFVSDSSSADGKDFELMFTRRTDKMPPPAREVKHHPSSVNQLILKQLIGDVKPSMTLVKFLTSQFECVPRSLALRLITELGRDFTAHMQVSELTLNHIRQIDSLLHEARFDKADGSCLSPAGEYNLRLGITKELKPTMVATHAEPAAVFEGHPFIVEAGVALGGAGTTLKPGVNVFRFANRIPLLFEGGNDVVTKTARDVIRWANYKISPTTHRIGVICSIVSTKVPFKGTGKEYIGDDAVDIKECVKRAITACCLQLKTKLVRRAAQKDAAERKKVIIRYAPDVAGAIVGLFSSVTDVESDTKDVWEAIQNGKVTKELLKNKLIEHVNQMDKEEALEKAATGHDIKEVVFLSGRSDAEYVHMDSKTGLKLSLLANLQTPL